MSCTWYFVNTGPGAASWNMALDEAMLEGVRAVGAPVLRFYAWSEPAASFGYFQHYEQIASWTSLRPLVRRPTGGGLVPHDADWTYSLVFPPDNEWHSLRAEESYRRAHEWVAQAMTELKVQAELANAAIQTLPGQCFAGAEKFDVLAGGRKIAGAAQKRNKLGLLIQGSLQPGAHRDRRTAWEEAMLRMGEYARGISWRELRLPAEILDRATQLNVEKYGTDKYNHRR